jgi:putative acetyltransferase
MTAIRVTEVATNDPILRPLIASHSAHSLSASPPGSCHFLDHDAVVAEPGLRMWVAYEGEEALGCAAMKPLDGGAAEVKSVHVLSQARGRGIARLMMDAVLDAAQISNVTALYLETGSKILAAYDPARALYERLGFDYCDPFGNYSFDPHSTFMVRAL